jgi:hypothetical protein
MIRAKDRKGDAACHLGESSFSSAQDDGRLAVVLRSWREKENNRVNAIPRKDRKGRRGKIEKGFLSVAGRS